MSPSSPVVLASGQVTSADLLRLELHRPLDAPAFVLVRWPEAPSVLSPTPKTIANAAAALVRVLADAQAKLATIRSWRADG